MKLLAIETSGKTFSVALSEKGRVISEIFWDSGLKHSERLIPAVERILKKAGWKISELKKVAVSTGPGSFTGIRVGLSCAKTIAQSLSIPLVGINTLDVIRAGLPKSNYELFPAIDALRNEWYIENKKGEVIIEESDKILKKFSGTNSKIFFAGSAAEIYRSKIIGMMGKKAVIAPKKLNYPRAAILAAMAQKDKGISWNKTEPLYIRRSWAEKKKKF